MMCSLLFILLYIVDCTRQIELWSDRINDRPARCPNPGYIMLLSFYNMFPSDYISPFSSIYGYPWCWKRTRERFIRLLCSSTYLAVCQSKSRRRDAHTTKYAQCRWILRSAIGIIPFCHGSIESLSIRSAHVILPAHSCRLVGRHFVHGRSSFRSRSSTASRFQSLLGA